MSRQFAAPAVASATTPSISPPSTAWSMARTRAKVSARGRHFLHPKLGFSFMAPPGFTLDNTAQAVLGLKDRGDEALRLDVVSVPAEQSLPDISKSGWMENVDPGSVEEFTVNGFPWRRPRPRAAPAGRSASSPYASAATSTVSSSRRKSRTEQADRAFREIGDRPSAA